MNTNRKRLASLLVVIVIGLMVPPVVAREYRPTMVGPSRWVSGYEEDTFVDVSEPSECCAPDPIAGAAEIVGGAIEATGELIEGTAEVAGEAGGGILTWVGDVAIAAGGIVGGTWEFLFGGWGCPS